MENPLVDPLEPDFNGGLLNPLLEWADSALPERLTADTPAEILHSMVAVTMSNGSAQSLSSVFTAWFRSRTRSHLPYYCLSAALVLAWLVACLCLLSATLCKERRRQKRLRAPHPPSQPAATGTDAVDAAGASTGAAFSSASPYRLFYRMLVRRYRSLRSGDGRRGQKRAVGNRNGSAAYADDVSSCSGQSRDMPDYPAWPIARAATLSTKSLSGQDRHLLGHASAAMAVWLICAVFLLAYFTQAGSLVTFTSTAQDSSSVRSIVTATVGHLDRFLTRSLSESNQTIIGMFEQAYPPVERLFMDFGEELLALLMSDYKIDKLISQLEAFLSTVNASMIAMRYIAGSREAVIKPLQQFSAQLQVHREGLQGSLASMCREHQGLFPGGSCQAAVARLPDLRLSINDTKLETDSSVTIVTLLNKMLNLDIDNVQRQVQKAKESLSTGLKAISGVVRQLLGGLVSAVSSQFSQAESAIARVKSGYDLVATDPQLWGAVEAAGRAVLSLVVLSCLVFLLTCALGAILLWALVRYLRLACRIDKFGAAAAGDPTGDPASPASAPSASGQSALSLSAIRQSSSSTSGISSGGAHSRSSPQWPPQAQSPLPAAPQLHPHTRPQPGSFSERWLDLDFNCDWTPPSEEEKKATDSLSLPPLKVWETRAAVDSAQHRQPVQKLEHLVEKEWNSFVYCCSFDCSLALMVGALLSLLPLLFSLAFFYASAEIQVDACRYLATTAGNQRWDEALDAFSARRIWPLVQQALEQRPDLPISIPSYPQRLIHAIRTDCSDANQTVFSIFGLTGLLNATALLAANATRAQFTNGASLIKAQINATDAETLIPPELDSLRSVLPQVAGVLDSEDYSASIAELRRPLLAMPDAVTFVAELERLAATVLATAPTDSNAVIVRHTAGQLNASLARSVGHRDRLDQLQGHYSLLQASRNFTGMTNGLLAALKDVRLTLTDKAQMLAMVDVRFGPTLERHLPKFAGYLDPLAANLLGSVGHCDDLHRALETLSVDLCYKAVPRANLAAFLLLLTTAFFALLFCLIWWLLVRVGRHQTVVTAARYLGIGFDGGASDAAAEVAPAAATSAAAAYAADLYVNNNNNDVSGFVPMEPARLKRVVRFGESAV